MESDMDESLRKRRIILDYLNELGYALEPFYRIDFDKLKNIKRLVKDLEQEFSQYRFPTSFKTVAGHNKRVDLVGLLPLMLMSEEMFPTHKSLIDFSGNVLGIELKRLTRPSRTRIVGEILLEVAKLPAKDLDKILAKLQEIIRNKMVHAKSDFFMEWDSAIRRMRSAHAESET